MAKGMYQYIGQAWKKPDEKRLRELMITWRSEPSLITIEKPTRLDRARILGYKAKKGYIIVRVRLPRGGRKRHQTNKGRRSKRHTNKKVVKMSYQWIAEARCQKKFTNLEVLNSYDLGKDGVHYFYEVIMVDPERPEIKSDPKINWICSPKNRNRALRGLTTSAKKSRGLTSKTPTNKNRPSVRSNHAHGK
jgi:large subunit ribosomal protein L15e